eukprot:gene14089-18908_t
MLNSDMTKKFPEQFLCPITLSIMSDPVMDLDGITYERSAIMNWLVDHKVSPITRNPLHYTQLIPNRALRSAIEEYLKSEAEAESKADSKKDESKHSDSKHADLKQEIPVDVSRRKPITIFAVIDHSGSMSDSSGVNAQGENDGYIRLDLVRHTLSTIISSLDDQDRICIIKFSTVAKLFAAPIYLSKTNKKSLIQQLEYLDCEGQTNIWDGMRMAIDMIGDLDLPASENVQIYLLTDGEPNLNPPGDLVKTIQQFLHAKCQGGAMPTINTFGYGYKLDSLMLSNMAEVGNGLFGFIPDGTMVGTVFINALSHSLLDEKSSPLAGNPIVEYVKNKCVWTLNEVLTDVNCDRAELLLKFVDFAQDVLLCIENGSAIGDDIGRNTTQEQKKSAARFVTELLSDSSYSSDPNNGQLEKATTNPDYYSKWGMHYMFSYMSALRNEVCINFKDKAIQLFKSDKFVDEQSRIEMCFVQLPPPTPTAYKYAYTSFQHGAGGRNRPQASANLAAAYYNANGGCVSGDSKIFVYDNNKQIYYIEEIQNIKKDMIVLSHNGPTTVECVVKIRYYGDLYEVEKMKLTAYHPIMIEQQSFFPNQYPKVNKKCDYDGYVFDLVLTKRGLLCCPLTNQKELKLKENDDNISMKDKMFIATFGHLYQENNHFKHDYFATDKVINDLKSYGEYKKGFLQIDDMKYIRSTDTNQVCGMKMDKTVHFMEINY